MQLCPHAADQEHHNTADEQPALQLLPKQPILLCPVSLPTAGSAQLSMRAKPGPLT